MEYKKLKMLQTRQLLLLFILVIFVLITYYILLYSEIKPNALLHEAKQNKITDVTNIIDSNEDLVVLYNRVPKTGSTSFVNIAYDLCKKNKFHVLHINVTANMHVLSLPNQIKFVKNVTSWKAMKPAFYHGHMAYLDFSKFQTITKPIYLNLIRKPLDRLVSYYYFLRYGDNYRPNLVRKKAGNKITFDECVKLKQPDCDPKNMWLQIPFFCGHASECWEPGSEWALNQAKHNLVNEYFLVGVTEEMESFIDLLEKSLPRIFKGFTEHYLNSNKSHLRQTTSKIEPTQETVEKIMGSKIWKMENELYEFALEQFEFNRKKLTIPDKNKPQSFMYEKVRPK
ncbi:heparin sulfate O-sulfotransferase isoform X2 [Condylostylus longicornis]|uniref:heparin sulfate O-sulfotransferase isoform X2 n=1 Tax=Condylostylus longicornis TaxID=2530218 RepID=UPI00244E59F3|nr:heparin sulfate O-sulfotransferase isoform X2 [Condylostylus longicornis]